MEAEEDGVTIFRRLLLFVGDRTTNVAPLHPPGGAPSLPDRCVNISAKRRWFGGVGVGVEVWTGTEEEAEEDSVRKPLAHTGIAFTLLPT